MLSRGGCQAIKALLRNTKHSSSSSWTRSRTQLKKIRVPPTRLIAEWLEKNDQSSCFNTELHRSDKFKIPLSDLSSIQGILLEYLKQGPTHEITAAIERLGYSADSLRKWSQILKSSDDAQLYCTSQEELPFFLLLIILRCRNISTDHLQSVIVHTWHRLAGLAQKGRGDQSYEPDWHVHPWKLSSAAAADLCRAFRRIEENALTVLISRLLSHARRILPRSIPSIACLFACYLWFAKGTLETHERGTKNAVDGKTHRRLCMLHDQMIKKLSLPAQMNPAKNMRYAWQGQRTLLDLAGRFDPPLILHQDSYRGIIRTLSALRKSPAEEKLAAHMAAGWPPWREEQDGVDAERPMEDDLSRAVLASRRMTEAGYHLDHLDAAMQVKGGREKDGTPTIPTRHVSTRRSGRDYGSQRLWAARVEATRSVREAWMAFLEFDERKGKITLDLYHTVFAKLVYERWRVSRSQTSDILPGEAKEVVEHTAPNASAYELARTQPLEEDMLYDHMISTGLAPEGRFLNFLVRSAPSIAAGVRYLHDGRLPQDALAAMLDCTAIPDTDRRLLDQMPLDTMHAFIHLLARFPRHAVRVRGTDSAAKQHLHGIAKFNTPLHYAIQLVRLRQPLSPPLWHALFHGLSLRHAAIASDRARDDVLAWLVTTQILTEYHRLHLALDATGFLRICVCFQKALLAASGDLPPDVPDTWRHDGARLLKGEWDRLTRSTPDRFSLPSLAQAVPFVTIHAYVRVVGIRRDWQEMIAVAEWMVRQKCHIDATARESRSGAAQRSGVFVAMKSFLEEAWAEERLKEMSEVDRGPEESGMNEGCHGGGAGDRGMEEARAARREWLIAPRRGGSLDGEVGAAREALKALLEREGLEEWGGWPGDEATRAYRCRGRSVGASVGVGDGWCEDDGALA